jgi:hypothetical protein
MIHCIAWHSGSREGRRQRIQHAVGEALRMLPGDPFRTFDIRAPQFVEEFHVIVDVKSAARPSDLRRSSTADDRSPRAARPTSNRLRVGDGATLVLLACGAS